MSSFHVFLTVSLASVYATRSNRLRKQTDVVAASARSCEGVLPWTQSAEEFARVVRAHSRTDKIETSPPKHVVHRPYNADEDHNYQHMYYKYFMQLVHGKCDASLPEEDRTVRILEIGLGCGMPRGPGGGVEMFHALIKPPLILDLHVMEYDRPCGEQWKAAHPEFNVALHFGDQGSEACLDQAYAAAGNKPFDLIIDDGAHDGAHQYVPLLKLYPHVVPGGVYVVEDLMWWDCEVAIARGWQIEGKRAEDCNPSGKPTLMSHVFTWQQQLALGGEAPSQLPELLDIDMYDGLAVFVKSPARSAESATTEENKEVHVQVDVHVNVG